MADHQRGQRLPLSWFDFELPGDRIAHRPASPRHDSRLLFLPRGEGALSHRVFRELPELLEPGDLLIFNDTRVLPARVWAHKPTGGRVEVLLTRPVDDDVAGGTRWRALCRPARGLEGDLELRTTGGARLVARSRAGAEVILEGEEPLVGLMDQEGEMPLPPYIDRTEADPRDEVDYQTVFARRPGAVAAPTAALHFTPEVLEGMEARGIRRASVTLHVGPGTFLPVRPELAEDVREHPMHGEWYEIPGATLSALEETRAGGGRVVAVGTTSVRALETWERTGAACGESTLFIYPGFEFRVIDAMVTNFHLPRSTLLMLVSALAGRERVLEAYRVAVTEGYRFYSYGDAMLIL